jgi:hypothetical protein
VRDEETDILKWKGRISGYQPTYLNGGRFVEKLIYSIHMKKPYIWE